MPTIEIEKTISAAFRGGEVLTRELRLTEAEAEYIRAHYPAVLIPQGESGGKGWYEITFQGADN